MGKEGRQVTLRKEGKLSGPQPAAGRAQPCCPALDRGSAGKISLSLEDLGTLTVDGVIGARMRSSSFTAVVISMWRPSFLGGTQETGLLGLLDHTSVHSLTR